MSTKNKNKKLRNITVDGKQYKWLVCDFDCDGDGGLMIKVWTEDKIQIVNRYVTGINIPEDGFTPKHIREMIKTAPVRN